MSLPLFIRHALVVSRVWMHVGVIVNPFLGYAHARGVRVDAIPKPRAQTAG